MKNNDEYEKITRIWEYELKSFRNQKSKERNQKKQQQQQQHRNQKEWIKRKIFPHLMNFSSKNEEKKI